MAILTDRTALGAAPASDDLLHLVDVSDTTDDTSGTSKKITVSDLFDKLRVSTIPAVINGGGSVLSTGTYVDVPVHFDCTIQEVVLYADQSGSVQVDIWKDAHGNFPPTDADSITASAEPSISGAQSGRDTTLSGWITSVSAGDVLRFYVDSVNTITQLTIALKVQRSL